MKPNIDYTLYLVTDSELMSTATVEESVEMAICGGVTMVQLREKTASSREFYNTALNVQRICCRHNIPLIINDRVDIALAVNAGGVHVGQSDLCANVVRRMIGPNKIIGVSVCNVDEAVAAARAGADYIGVGGMYPTSTKTDARLTSMEELQKIRQGVKLPIVVIGGINKNTVPNFYATGVDGIAVVSAIVASKDVTGAARELKEMFVAGKSKV